jgi:hypothetical protein
MDAQTLETVVGRFVEAALHWRDRLEANATAAETDVPDATHQAWVRA